MKDCINDRFDMILVTTTLLKLCCNLIHSSQHKNKFILCKTNILKFLSNIFQFLSLSFILSFHSFLNLTVGRNRGIGVRFVIAIKGTFLN